MHSLAPRAVAAAAAVLLAALVVPGSTATAAPAAKPARNAWGVQLVHFQPGTSPEHMRNAVLAAGGVLLTDTSRIGRVSALPQSAGFATRLRRDPAVAAVWEDKLAVRVPEADAAPAGRSGDAAGRSGAADCPGFTDADATPLRDPFHSATSWCGETNPRGIMQWDDLANGALNAWATTQGDRTVRIAVIDTGVSGATKELRDNSVFQGSINTIPCNTLTRMFRQDANHKGYDFKDCSSQDTHGHGTWVASRIAGALNGSGSNGVAPRVQVLGVKSLATGFGGLTSWIVDGMVQACALQVDAVNMSLGDYNGFDDPELREEEREEERQDYLTWVAGVDYCRARGVAVFAAAGNEHVRVNRVDRTLTTSTGSHRLVGAGQVDPGPQGIATTFPGTSRLARYSEDLRGLFQVPAGVPGVVMVSSTNNANGRPDRAAVNTLPSSTVGARDQLAYYSNYGSRVDLAAPGGARKFNIPRFDGGPGDILYGGWGELAAVDDSGELCRSSGDLGSFACFRVAGQGYGWLQGTSMATPNATGVAALTLSTHPELQGRPDALAEHLRRTARTVADGSGEQLQNATGPNDPHNTSPGYDPAVWPACTTGFCHLGGSPVPFTEAYGAGIVDAGAAVSTEPISTGPISPGPDAR